MTHADTQTLVTCANITMFVFTFALFVYSSWTAQKLGREQRKNSYLTDRLVDETTRADRLQATVDKYIGVPPDRHGVVVPLRGLRGPKESA